MLEAKVDRQEDGTLFLSLAGSLDEEADIASVFQEIDGDVVIDLSKVRRLNSLGVHRWITALNALSDRVSVRIECCSYPVALQASYVANLFGNASVVSTLAPFFCSDCGYNEMVLLKANEVANGSPPDKQCPSCQAKLQFDELDTYLQFLSVD